MNRNANASTRSRSQGAIQNTININSIAPLENLLNRLEGVRQSGDGYRANCPNQQHRSLGSLAVRATSDGTVLIKCHAGCSPVEVLHAVGLELADLFERPTETINTPRPSWQQRELLKMRQWKACRSDFIAEANTLLSVAGQAYHGYEVTAEDKARIERAARIIRGTLGAL